MPSYLPPYQPPPYSAMSPANTGYMSLPVESTSGGFGNNVWNQDSSPYPGGFTDDNARAGLTPDVNPYTQGYFSGGKWNPYLPGKIVLHSPTTNLGSVPGGSGPIGAATQWVNGQQVNVGANNYAAGTSSAAPYQFGTAPGDARMSEAAPMNGYGFGQQGQPGYKFMGGSMDGGKFYADQPDTLNPTPNKNLGVFKPWNPALNALQQSRSQP